MAGASAQVLQFPVSTSSLDEHISSVIADAEAGRGKWICTLNLEMIGRALRHRSYADLLSGVDTFIADGASILLLARLLDGQAPRGRSTGVDLVKALLEAPACPAIAMIGGHQPARVLETLSVPRTRVAYINDGVIGTDPASLDRLAGDITASGSRILLVGLGVPKQDIVCSSMRARLPSVVMIGVGGSFDILGGLRRRAPDWMRRAGFEWLFRLLQEPKRLSGRYLVDYPLTIGHLVRLAVTGIERPRQSQRAS